MLNTKWAAKIGASTSVVTTFTATKPSPPSATTAAPTTNPATQTAVARRDRRPRWCDKQVPDRCLQTIIATTTAISLAGARRHTTCSTLKTWATRATERGTRATGEAVTEGARLPGRSHFAQHRTTSPRPPGLKIITARDPGTVNNNELWVRETGM